MSTARRPGRLTAAAIVGALATALAGAPAVHAEATVNCAGTVVTVSIKWPLKAPLVTTVEATNATTVVVNAGTTNADTKTCAGMTAIVIDATKDGDTVSYTGSLPSTVTVTANLMEGGDSFTAAGTQGVTANGGDGDDTLIGGGGADTLKGELGNDVLQGRAGSDTLQGGGGTNAVSYEDRAALQPVEASLTTGFGGDDTPGSLETDALTDIADLIGGAGDDTLTGKAGTNVLIGGTGADTLDGMAGDDLLRPGSDGGATDGGPDADTVNFDDAPVVLGGVTVIARLAAPSGASVAGVAQGLTNVEHITGSPGDDVLIGDTTDNTLTGGAGDHDTVSYVDRGTGHDVTASLLTNSGGETDVDTYATIENLTGGDGDDTLISGPTKNVLDGGAAGSDTASYLGRPTDVTASLATGTGGAEGDEFLRIDNLTGGLGSDILTGADDANNVLDGGAGGSDTVSYDDRVAGENVVASLVSDKGGEAGEQDLLLNIDHLVGGAGEDTLTGDGLVNRLEGGDGDDTLIGGAEADTLRGDAGDDVLQPSTGTDAVEGGTHGTAGGVHGGAGDVLSYADLAIEIVASLQNAQVTVSGDTQTMSQVEGLAGGSGDDTLTGTAGPDLLSGGPGDDELHPLAGGGSNAGGTHGTAGGAHGAGGDTVSYSDLVAPASATASLAAGSGSVSAGDTQAISEVEHLTGGPGDDTLIGDGANNLLTGGAGTDTVSYADRGPDHDVTASLLTDSGGETDVDTYATIENLTGGEGDDILISGPGKNVLDGGAGGSDTASYAGQPASVTASLLTGGPAGDEFKNIDNLTGGNVDDTLTGDGEDNVLDGGPGTSDTVSYADRGATEHITASLATGGGDPVLGEQDTFPNVENLTGGAGGDTLTGDANANVLDGGPGADTLLGAGGDDTLRPRAGAGTLNGGDGTDEITFSDATAQLSPAITLTVDLASATATVKGAADETHTVADVENVTGTAGDDRFIGTLTANVFDGVSGARDTVSYADRGPAQAVSASLASGLGGTGGEGDQYIAIDDLTGGAGGDQLTGHVDANVLRGGAGTDDLFGGGGDDLLAPGLGGGTNDGGTNTAAGDTVTYDDLLIGVDASLAGTADVGGATQTFTDVENLTGGPGDDTLAGTAGDNVLTGGAGKDTASYAGRLDDIKASLLTGKGGKLPEVDTYVTIENLTGGLGGDLLVGDHGPNVLRGGAGTDHLGGNGGDDVLVPGTGLGGSSTGGAHDTVGDTVSLADFTTSVVVDLVTDKATASGLTETLAEIENATGGEGDDTLISGTAKNVLDGGAAGSDTVSYAGRAAAVVASLATGRGGSEQDAFLRIDNLTGGDGDDTLSGDDFANKIDGGLAGTDTASYADRIAGEDVVASLVTDKGGVAGEQDDFAEIENLVGGAGEDTLTGDGLVNFLAGGDGDDSLFGDGEADTLLGDGGDDVLAPADGADVVKGGTHGTAGGVHGEQGDVVTYVGMAGEIVASIAGEEATVGGLTHKLEQIEGLTGGAGDDTLTGSSGADLLDGGPGDDELHPLEGGGSNVGDIHGTAGGTHGAGGDTVSYADLLAPASAVASLAPGPGTGSVSGGATHAIAGVENLIGGPGEDTLTGDANPNVLAGGAARDTLSGEGGTDVVRGENGDDVLAGGDGADVLEGADGSDSISGGAGADALRGGNAGDVLAGGDGDDVAEGHAGDDTLTHGAGADLLDGGTDVDRASYESSTDAVTVTLDGKRNDGTGGGAEGDEVVGIEHITGGQAGDRLEGNQGVNDLRGSGGDDVVVGGGGGDDPLFGGTGFDTLSYDDRGAGEAVTMTLNGIGGANGEFDTTQEFEALLGGAGDDRLTGSALADVIRGAAGEDVVSGAGGDDSLYGETGGDTLHGGAGADGLDAGAGNDRLDGGSEIDGYAGGDGNDDVNAFDGNGEIVSCGAGDDRADHDLVDGFPLADCESRVLLGYTPPPFTLDPRPRDRDRDGSFAGPDCNDLDPTISPAAPDVPGNDIDENCNGVDAPFPVVGTTFKLGFDKAPRGTRIEVFELRKVPANATIEIRCTSKRAPRCVFSKRIRTIGARRAKVSVRGYFGDRSLSRGTRVEVRILAPRTIGRVRFFTLGKPGAQPPMHDRCLPPGTTTPVAC